MSTASCGAQMMAPRPGTRPVARRFRLAALSRPRALASRGGHVPLRARSFARRLGFLGLAFSRPCLIHRRRGDTLRGALGTPTLFQICLDVVVLTLAFVCPSILWHRSTSTVLSCKERAR